jgi:formylglycine-generating enzyme required for sulfatase activity
MRSMRCFSILGILGILGILALSILSFPGLSAQGSVEGRRFAILVGVNQYFDSGFVSLQKTQNDAEELGRTLSRLGGYKEWSDSVAPAAKGSVEKRVAALSGRNGSLEVTTNPDAEAELMLTPAGGGTAQRIGTAPLDYETLIGDYSLSATATLNGKKLAGKATVSLREGQTSPIRLDLKELATVPSGFVLVPGGMFTIGSPASEAGRYDNEVQHQMSLSAFTISATDVTVGEFKAFVNATGYRTSGEADGKGGYFLTGSKWEQKADATWKNPHFAQSDQSPVVLVSWYDAVAYCNWKSRSEGKDPAYRYKGEADPMKWPSGWNTKTHNGIACPLRPSGSMPPKEAPPRTPWR